MNTEKARLNDGAQTMVAPMPTYIRLPKTGENEHYAGLKRDLLSSFGSEWWVRSKNPRKPGAKRHIRLVHLQSLLDHTDALPEGGEFNPGEDR